MTVDVEAVLVAPTQLEGNTSGVVGRVGTPVLRVARLVSWTSGPCVARVELVMAWRSDRLGWRFDHQPLFHGRSDHLGSWSDCQPLYRGQSDYLGSRSDRKPLFWAWSGRVGVRSDR
jgi:hypothetical protein